jgi:ribonucleotide monophosphatase NagD (HAD superfamily)
MSRGIGCRGIAVALGGGVGADGMGEPQHVGKAMTEAAFMALEPPPREVAGALLLGGDYSFTYAGICHASLYLQKHDTTLPYLASSMDAFDQLGDRRHPGPTAIMAFGIEQATGRRPVVVGKPSAVLAEALTREHGLTAANTLMVGDRLDSDIAFGKNGGFRTALVLTGVTDQAALDQAGTSTLPDGVYADLAAVVESYYA